MYESPNIVLTVPLTVPLEYAHRMEREAIRRNMSIADMLSAMLLDADDLRQAAAMEDAAAERMHTATFTPRTTPDVPFDPDPQLTCRTPAAVDSGSSLPPVGDMP